MNEQQRHRCAELMLDRLHERFSDRAVGDAFLAFAPRYRNGAEGLMLNRFQGWRERGWSVADASTYAQAWQRYGGSVATHPLVVERLAQLADIPVRYLAWEQSGEVKAAIPTWGRDLALSKDVLKRKGKKGLFDLGNAEIILPAAEDAQVPCVIALVICRP